LSEKEFENKEKDKDKEETVERAVSSQVSEKILISTGIRVGTLVKTKSMVPFISRIRHDGLHIIDVNKTINRVEVAGKFIARSDIKRVVVCSSKDYGKTPVEMFCSLTEAIPMVGRFMPGTFTNPLFSKHIDPEIVMVVDPSLDAQPIDEAKKVGTPVIALCDTNNVTENIDVVIPANNRGRKALAAIFWLLTKSVLTNTGILPPDEQLKYSIEDFETKLIEDDAK
jgi:small subunit ribosomal protein S2